MSSSSSSISAVTERAYRFVEQKSEPLSQKLANKTLTLDLSKVLGKGGFSVVHPAKNPLTNSPLAVKIFNPVRFRAADLEREVAILWALQGAPHTVQIRGVLQDGDSHGIALSRCKGEMLWTIIAEELESKKCLLPMSKVFDIARQVLEALAYFKSQNIVHGDIKGENCFWDQEANELTLVDFGTASLIGRGFSKCRGSREIQSPEALRYHLCHFGNDMWALGMMLFDIYTGATLFPINELPTSLEFAQQFGGPFLQKLAEFYTGSEEERSLRAEAQIKTFVDKVDKDLKWHTIPWRDRIRKAAKRKNEQAEPLIAFLEKIFVEKPNRIEAEAALKSLCDRENTK